MLEGREEHNALILISVILCMLGAIALTVGIFVSCCSENYDQISCILSGSGGLSVVMGMGVGKYTKLKSQR